MQRAMSVRPSRHPGEIAVPDRDSRFVADRIRDGSDEAEMRMSPQMADQGP